MNKSFHLQRGETAINSPASFNRLVISSDYPTITPIGDGTFRVVGDTHLSMFMEGDICTEVYPPNPDGHTPGKYQVIKEMAGHRFQDFDGHGPYTGMAFVMNA